MGALRNYRNTQTAWAEAACVLVATSERKGARTSIIPRESPQPRNRAGDTGCGATGLVAVAIFEEDELAGDGEIGAKLHADAVRLLAGEAPAGADVSVEIAVASLFGHAYAIVGFLTGHDGPPF